MLTIESTMSSSPSLWLANPELDYLWIEERLSDFALAKCALFFQTVPLASCHAAPHCTEPRHH
jgi:hypothetical protein